MYLEKLEINGFKSFANKNKLIFSGILADHRRGLTAIVGPNGSGKSNVADAIRWVLGEQSLKTLRGKKSEDVIFSGSDKKGRLGMAEVSLYLNNEEKISSFKKKDDGLLPENEAEKENHDRLNEIISSCNEIVITRRLYRSGDSEYLLNGNRARLGDVQMLLAKANFGQKTYSVIGQGMVENFLTASASERKDFFDEATGVKQFQIKRDSALNKLESSYENLQQVDMLLTEIKPRLKSLTRQVEKLKRRESVEDDLKITQTTYYRLLWHEINKKLKTANTSFLEIETEKLEKEKKLDKFDEELNKLRGADNFKEINELEPRLREKESQRNQALKQLAKLQAEMEAKLEAKGQFDVSWLNNKLSELESDYSNALFEIESLSKSRKNEEESLIKNELSEIEKELTKNNSLKQEIRRLQNEKENEERNISRIETIIETNLEIQGRFDVNRLNEKKNNLQNSLNSLAESLKTLNEEKDNNKEKELSEEIFNLEKEIRVLNNSLENINREIKKNKGELQGKEEIEKLIDNFLSRLDEIGKESNLETVRKLVAEAKEEFRVKIKALIAGENIDELERIKNIQEEIISLTEKKQNLNSKLNEEKIRLSSLREKIISLSEKKNDLEKELKEVEADLLQANVKFDIKKAEDDKRDISKKITALKNEIEDLERKDESLELETKKRQIENKWQEWRLEESSRLERSRLLENKKISLTREIEDIKDKLARSEIKFDASEIKNEENEIRAQITTFEEEIKKLKESLEKLNTARDEEKSKLFEIQKNAQSIQNELNSLNNRLNSLQIEITRQETRLEDLENSIRNDELSISEIEKESTSEETESAENLLRKINSAKNQLEQIGGIDPEAEKEYEETKTRFDFLSSQTEDLNKAIKSLEEIITELDKNIKVRFDAEFKVISEKFAEYFKILFNGGNAKIAKLMAEEKDKSKDNKNDDLEKGLEAGFTKEELEIKNEINDKLKRLKSLRKQNGADLEGIDIQAIPPGKKIQTVTMLSGGERALTAIALICAIISANPSPFVVLDEVDAALDEANSERLAKILDDLSNKTQFIVITHNRASMKKASILYGVTMEADGVSKLLSVKLDEIKLDK